MTVADQRPRSITELVDAGFTLYRANFLTVITIAVLVIAPSAIAKAVVPAELERIVELVLNLIIPIGTGAITSLVVAAVERNETLDVRGAFLGTAGHRDSLIAVQIEAGLLVFLGLLLLIVPGLIAIAWTAVCVPVVMIENLGYSKAVTRSRVLAKGHLRHALGTTLLSWLLLFAIIVGVGTLAGIVGITGGILDMVSDMFFALALPLPAIVMTLLYYDLRVRNESADLDAMISALPTPSAQATPG